MVDRSEFNTVMTHFAARFKHPLDAATLALYREALDEAGLSTDEFRQGARRVFRVAGSWAFASPDAFVKAAKQVRRERREAAERTAEAERAAERTARRDAERLERGDAFGQPAVPFTPITAPRFEGHGQRSTRCDCGRWFRQSMLAVAYVDAAAPRWRSALLEAFPQGLVPDECPACTRRTIGHLEHRSQDEHAERRELAWAI